MKESVDLKILLMYLGKKFYLILLPAIIGALILGGGYFLSRHVFAPAPDYEAKSQIYLTYADDVRIENIYINDYTWSVLVTSDECVEEARKNLPFDADPEYLRSVATAGLESDLRLLVVTVTDKDPERAVEIARAYEVAICRLTEKMDDITHAEVFSSADCAQAKQFSDRTLKMALAGLIVGAFAGLALFLFVFSVDDSVFAPKQTKEKYGFPTLLCIGKDKKPVSDWEKKAAGISLKEILSEKNSVFVSDISAETGCDAEDAKAYFDVIQELSEVSDRLVLTDGINQNPEAVKSMKDGDGVLLLLKAGAKNGKLAERALSYLEIQQIPVLGFVLYNTDSKWMLRYLSDR